MSLVEDSAGYTVMVYWLLFSSLVRYTKVEDKN